ncbi:dihydrofolate reductase [Shimia sp. MMG029]|uniref:dihydrofolate reductase n=1 Tax=Shimia sp. MMG029 TaxID=3021978 RepID=UPI0022FDFD50|nr:dihydrofolate reductase [Shimia sp. MMG029]MDA5556121.1 dihydrofolate reductase [Shimia sp. MMG029]
MISLVVARARNGAIGRDGDIPWRIPQDFKLFQRETTGGAVIMGRNTWDSLPVKPLAKRLNIVVSSQPDAAEIVVPSVQEAVRLATAQGYDRIYGIGGAGIYKEMLKSAHRLLITEVDAEIEDADTFFPAFDPTQWELITRRPLEGASPTCVVCEYLRIVDGA